MPHPGSRRHPQTGHRVRTGVPHRPPTRGVYPLRSEPFRVSRLALAYLAVAQYVRSYWWFAAAIPIFGLIAFVVGDGILRAMGLMALLWPLSLPARAVFATSKTGKLMERGAWSLIEDGFLYLHATEGEGGMKLNLASVRSIETRRGFLVLVRARGDFVGLPLSALPVGFPEEVRAQRDLAVRTAEG